VKYLRRSFKPKVAQTAPQVFQKSNVYFFFSGTAAAVFSGGFDVEVTTGKPLR
jgi:threonine aldolase